MQSKHQANASAAALLKQGITSWSIRITAVAMVKCLLNHHDAVHLDLGIFWQGSNAHCRTGRVGLLEITRHLFVDQSEVLQVGEENIQFDDLLQTAARSEERRVGKECRSRWSP